MDILHAANNPSDLQKLRMYADEQRGKWLTILNDGYDFDRTLTDQYSNCYGRYVAFCEVLQFIDTLEKNNERIS